MDQVNEDEAAPLTISVTGGNPTDEELGAVLAVLQAALTPVGVAEKGDDRPRAGGWRSHTRMMRRQFQPGREAWRFSGIPGAM